MDNAAYLAAPRVRRRIVRVVNAPQEGRRHPPPTLKHWWTDALHRRGFEPVGRYHGRPTERDIDYVVPRSAAGDDLIALLGGRDRTDRRCAALHERRHRSIDLVLDVTRRPARRRAHEGHIDLVVGGYWAHRRHHDRPDRARFATSRVVATAPLFVKVGAPDAGDGKDKRCHVDEDTRPWTKARPCCICLVTGSRPSTPTCRLGAMHRRGVWEPASA
jgi:hypothetical protein